MIEFDAAKREMTLFVRGLDMARANEREIKKYQARLG